MNVDVPVSVELMLEEPSAEVTVRVLVPKIIPGVDFTTVAFNSKNELLRKLPGRLRGCAVGMPFAGNKVVVLVDRDADDCARLRKTLNDIVVASGLRTASAVRDRETGDVLLRIVVEELEAWFFGDVPAIRKAYPRVPENLADQVKYRDPDAISGGTWEALELVLQRHGYHRERLRKLTAAAEIAPHMDVENNRSRSFQVFRDGPRCLVKEGS